MKQLGCSNCRKITNHRVLYQQNESQQKEYDYHARLEYMLIQRLGCNEITYRHEFHNFETQMKNSFNVIPGYETIVQNYPAYLDRYVGLNGMYSILSIIRNIYQETLDAITYENYILSGIGLKAIIEAIVKEKKIQGSSLVAKINNLVKSGVLSKKRGKFSTYHSIYPMCVKLFLKIQVII